MLIKLDGFIYFQDNITIDHTGGVLNSIFNDLLPELVYFPVTNNLPSRFHIPGRIEAEDFNNQFGLGTENTTDIGGGLNVGWTDNGDYAEYQVFIEKDGIYDLDLRTSAQFQQGLLEFELIGNESTESIGSFSTPITNGWQNWQTSSFVVNLLEGVYTLRFNVLQSGFNLNWFEFIYSDENLSVDDFHEDDRDVVKVYPNPVGEDLNINLGTNNNMLELTLYNVNGRIILKNDINQNSSKIQLKIPQVSSGIYVLSILTNEGRFFKRILKQ